MKFSKIVYNINKIMLNIKTIIMTSYIYNAPKTFFLEFVNFGAV